MRHDEEIGSDDDYDVLFLIVSGIHQATHIQSCKKDELGLEYMIRKMLTQ